MNKDKQYPDEYKLTSPMLSKIVIFLLIVFLLVLMRIESSWQEGWLVKCGLAILSLWLLFHIIQDVEYAIFSPKGVSIVHTKRWGKNKAKQEFYIDWKDVKYIKFNILITGHHSPPAIDIVSRIFGHGYDQPTCLPYGKFASLAIYYSGRKDIIYAKRKKPGLYEKDW